MNPLAPTTPYIDMVASQLRSQLVLLHNVLESIEMSRRYENDYVEENLKTVECELRRLRKSIQEQ